MTSQKKVIPIFFAVDDNYISILHVALQSLLSQASPEFFYNIHILRDNLSEANQKSLDVFNGDNVKIIINNVEEAASGRAKKMHAKYYHSKAIYYRIFIPEMFPEYKKVLYLDCDLVLNADISELFNYNIQGNYLGAIPCQVIGTVPIFTNYAEKFLGINAHEYFNSGVLVMNCEVLREVKFEEKFFELLDRFKLEICPDQDYLNLLCYGKTKIFPITWNKMPLIGSHEKLEELKLVHYNLSQKPWRYDNIPYGELFWKHAKNTTQYDALIKSKKRVIKPEVLRDRDRMRNISRMAKNLGKNAEETMVHIIYNGQAPDRLAVLERIRDYERKGLFDIDVEADPYYDQKNIKKFDLINKKITSKVKAKIATSVGKYYYNRMMRRHEVIVKGVVGLENLLDFSGGAVITCNHIHRFDNYAVLLGLKKYFGRRLKLWKVVKDGNWAYRGTVGFMLRNANTLPISQTNPKLMVECMRAAKTLLSRGEKILIYPEQAMWWNYRKPRPLKSGAFVIAAKAHAPVIPCFITLADSNIIGADGFPVQEFTLHILPVIKYDPNLSEKENAEVMKEKNDEAWQKVYAETYGEDITPQKTKKQA